MRYGRWFTAYRCVACKKWLSFSQVMYSLGTCPKCGNHDPGTVIDVEEVACRKVYRHPWWQFWKKPETEYRMNAGGRT